MPTTWVYGNAVRTQAAIDYGFAQQGFSTTSSTTTGDSTIPPSPVFAGDRVVGTTIPTQVPGSTSTSTTSSYFWVPIPVPQPVCMGPYAEIRPGEGTMPIVDKPYFVHLPFTISTDSGDPITIEEFGVMANFPAGLGKLWDNFNLFAEGVDPIVSLPTGGGRLEEGRWSYVVPFGRLGESRLQARPPFGLSFGALGPGTLRIKGAWLSWS